MSMENQESEMAKAQMKTGQVNQRAIHLKAKLRDGEVKIESDQHGPERLEKGSGPHRFTFHLHDHTMPSMGVCFCTVEEGVLDVDEGEDCPPATGINTDQVDPQMVRSTDKMAAFTDENSGCPRTLSYALHFKCDDPHQKPTYDPIIINGGA